MIDLIIFLGLLGLGYGFGQFYERRHYKSIIQREFDTQHIPLLTLKTVPASISRCEAELVAGNVVISVDYFKRFLSGMRALVGGRMKSYESLIDRARREAILRMKEQAIERGAIVVTNIRIETSSISKGGRRQTIGSLEVLAYGTAISPAIG